MLVQIIVGVIYVSIVMNVALFILVNMYKNKYYDLLETNKKLNIQMSEQHKLFVQMSKLRHNRTYSDN